MDAIMRKREIDSLVDKFMERHKGKAQTTPDEIIALLLAQLYEEGLPGRDEVIQKDRNEVDDRISDILDKQYGKDSDKAKMIKSDDIIYDRFVTLYEILYPEVEFADMIRDPEEEHKADRERAKFAKTYFWPFFTIDTTGKEKFILFGPSKRADLIREQGGR